MISTTNMTNLEPCVQDGWIMVWFSASALFTKLAAPLKDVESALVSRAKIAIM